MNPAHIIAVLTAPQALFAKMAQSPPSARQVFFGYVLWLGLIPAVCAFFGMRAFGWHFGVGDAIVLDASVAAMIAAAYYLCLFAGYVFAVALMRWMAPTYGATTHIGAHAALVAIVGTPLMLGGALHLYPLLPLNLMALAPAIIWSVYLLYTGVPKMLGADGMRGMLMASSMLGVFFVGAVAIAAASMILWVNGLGPDIGFDWRLSVEG